MPGSHSRYSKAHLLVGASKTSDGESERSQPPALGSGAGSERRRLSVRMRASVAHPHDAAVTPRDSAQCRSLLHRVAHDFGSVAGCISCRSRAG
jgi:hypothetical protein